VLACAPAWASHPLLTEDTDVLGKGTVEFELHGERSRGGNTELIVKLGYGFADNADVELELPYSREAGVDGRGDAGVSLKWRFYETEGLSFAFKPELFLPTGREELGLGAGRTRWAANLAGACELGRLEVLAHFGYTHNRNRIGEPESLRHRSVAARLAATGRLKLLADLAWENSARELVAGATYEPAERIELGVGLRRGLDDAAEGRAVRAGVKLRW
jgi:hypothetical protein